jgi:hypothetical protein
VWILTIVLFAGDGTHSQSLAPTNDVIDLTEPTGEADEDLVRFMRHVSVRNATHELLFFTNSDLCFLQALNLSEGLTVRTLVEAAQAKKIAKLE